MGKIRISKLGTVDEQAEKDRAKTRRLEKKKRLTHLAGMKGGQKVVDMSATTPEELALHPGGVATEIPTGIKKAVRLRGKAYLAAKKLFDHDKLYPISQAIELVKKITIAHFDGSVEVHINTVEKGLRGQVDFPHSTGRQIKVAIADDALLEKINSGKIDFDILVASPAMMPKLAKVAKILGPKGLMPNPKSGTISDKPEALAKKLSSGMTQFKTETEAPIIHMVIGKVSFPPEHLEENLKALLAAIGQPKIKSIFLKSTMSPAIRISIL